MSASSHARGPLWSRYLCHTRNLCHIINAAHHINSDVTLLIILRSAEHQSSCSSAHVFNIAGYLLIIITAGHLLLQLILCSKLLLLVNTTHTAHHKCCSQSSQHTAPIADHQSLLFINTAAGSKHVIIKVTICVSK